ncbi:hypothetical protein ACSVDA_06555 [Cytobacillus sp. Hm23]
MRMLIALIAGLIIQIIALTIVESIPIVGYITYLLGVIVTIVIIKLSEKEAHS